MTLLLGIAYSIVMVLAVSGACAIFEWTHRGVRNRRRRRRSEALRHERRAGIRRELASISLLVELGVIEKDEALGERIQNLHVELVNAGGGDPVGVTVERRVKA